MQSPSSFRWSSSAVTKAHPGALANRIAGSRHSLAGLGLGPPTDAAPVRNLVWDNNRAAGSARLGDVDRAVVVPLDAAAAVDARFLSATVVHGEREDDERA